MKPVFAIKDRAVNNYGEPMAMPSEQHAVRWFRDIVNSDPKDSAIARHPDDYDLYQVGEYNEETAALVPNMMPELTARAKDLIQPKG
ncbi:MAG: nonstructural protein [Microvirus sp.]|nr:MAG: nonstructural protein [Microvirus sp.]